MNRIFGRYERVLLFISIALLTRSPGSTQSIKDSSAINWISIEEAQNLMETEPKEIFIDVYADWCSWCTVMERETFPMPEVVDYVNKHYYAVRIDSESQELLEYKGQTLTHRQLAKSFNVQALPTIVFINDKLKKVRPISGYQDAEQFLKNLRRFNK